jgi:hypothetical protein
MFYCDTKHNLLRLKVTKFKQRQKNYFSVTLESLAVIFDQFVVTDGQPTKHQLEQLSIEVFGNKVIYFFPVS